LANIFLSLNKVVILEVSGKRTLLSSITWHSFATALLLFIPSIRLGAPFWMMEESALIPFLTLVSGYIASVLILTVARLRGRIIRLTDVIFVILAVFGLIFLGFLVTQFTLSRIILLGTFTLASAQLIVFFSIDYLRMLAGASLAVILSIALIFAFSDELSTLPQSLARSQYASEKVINTAFYNLNATVYSNVITKSNAEGGGISHFGDRYLLATGDGDLYVFEREIGNETLAVTQLPKRVPVNSDLFRKEAGEDIRFEWFRVHDVLVHEIGDNVRIFASHHFWKTNESCFVIRISLLQGSRTAILANTGELDWNTLYETKPCLPITKYIRGANRFVGDRSGGRMSLLDADTLLFTVGDLAFDGWFRQEILPQNKDASYGKTILIHLKTGTSEMFSLGHRNPQGLYIDDQTNIWLTEHGPQGGDELNLVSRGANYGWPFAIYGTEYGQFIWPLSRKQGEHDEFALPIYSWLPAIGISNLTGVERNLFPLWQGDLLVASLKAATVFRVRIRAGRAIFIEPIPIGMRIRDLIEDNSGRIIMWADRANKIISLEPAGSVGSGELLFARCVGCHEINDGSSHGIGPDLSGIIGRQIASAPDFDYSRALKSLEGQWTEEKLDAFLADPQSVVPGTSMATEGMPDKYARTKIIDYLSRH